MLNSYCASAVVVLRLLVKPILDAGHHPVSLLHLAMPGACVHMLIEIGIFKCFETCELFCFVAIYNRSLFLCIYLG